MAKNVKNAAVKALNNTYQLVSGFWGRWEGDKATGAIVTYEPNAHIHNITAAEVASLGNRLKLVSGYPDEAVAPSVPVFATPAKVEPDEDEIDAEVEDEEVEDDEEDAEDESAEPDTSTNWSELVNGTLAEVSSLIDSIDTEAELKALSKAEKKGADRAGVHKAIAKRLKAVRG